MIRPVSPMETYAVAGKQVECNGRPSWPVGICQTSICHLLKPPGRNTINIYIYIFGSDRFPLKPTRDNQTYSFEQMEESAKQSPQQKSPWPGEDPNPRPLPGAFALKHRHTHGEVGEDVGQVVGAAPREAAARVGTDAREDQDLGNPTRRFKTQRLGPPDLRG